MTDLPLVIAVGALLVVTVAVPIAAVVDMSLKPDRAWAAAGRSRQNWLAATIATTIIGFGIVGTIVAIVYFTSARRDLIEAMNRPPPRSRWS